MGVERREHVRQKVSRVEVRIASRESLKASYLRDLSLGGLFVRSRQPLATGTHVVVELSVEQRPAVRLRGEVVRQEQNSDGTSRGFGVRFSTVDDETRVALETILAEHREPAPPPQPQERAALEAELAEARGTLEAYEEAMALLRESEMDLAQRLEAAEAERGVLVNVAHELQSKVTELEKERTTLTLNVAALVDRLARGEAETKALRDSSARIAAELKAARAQVAQHANAHDEEVARLAKELELETAKSAELQATWDAEVKALRTQLEQHGGAALRAELQSISAQLDDERLKSMALQRALQRYVDMGGTPPPQR
jgi:uncharacterized protein (TIGR02266 family)